MVVALCRLLTVICPPVLGLLFAWGWRVNGHPLWVGLTIGGVGMLAAFAASPIALIGAEMEEANHTGIRRALAPLHVIWIEAASGIGLALLTGFIIGWFRGIA